MLCNFEFNYCNSIKWKSFKNRTSKEISYLIIFWFNINMSFFIQVDISVFKKNGEIVKYDFNALYKVSSRKNIIKAEAKINKILNELNEYIAKTNK